MTLHNARRFDLHLHTNRSDGRYEPDDVLARCARSKLDVVALTDHDLAAPIAPGPHEIDGHTVHVIAGAEVSGQHDGREFHLLVYFRDEVPEGFRAFCRQQMQGRAERYEQAVRSLDLPGLDGPDDAARRGERSITRLHLAKAVVEAGHAKHLRDAFHTFRQTDAVPRIALPFTEAIRIAREHGGITSWAHPPVRFVKEYLDTIRAAGLQGLEAHRPRVSTKDRRTLKKLAKRHGLVLTGGSDWHGWNGHELGLFHVTRYELEPFLELLTDG